jgi:hypothetical protein
MLVSIKERKKKSDVGLVQLMSELTISIYFSSRSLIAPKA